MAWGDRESKTQGRGTGGVRRVRMAQWIEPGKLGWPRGTVGGVICERDGGLGDGVAGEASCASY